jgi:hypothetical protein
MPRTIRESDAGFGSDSFLDVIANMVGILIILVVVVGIRVKQMPQVPKDLDPATVSELASREGAAKDLERNVLDLDRQMQHVQQLTAIRAEERAALALLLADGEREVNSRREALDKHGKDQFDLERELAATKARLERVERDREEAKKPKSKSVEIRNYPTPISQTVFGKEAHFQLRGGRVVHVPMEELQELFVHDAKEKLYRLRHESDITETVGPRGGFRLQYTLVRTGNMGQLEGYDLVPMNHRLGEPLNVALGPQSQFRAELSRLRAQQTTVTLWTYPDSFAEFRSLKKELYQLGFPVAARPLQEGQLIGGSPNGSKSAAE